MQHAAAPAAVARLPQDIWWAVAAFLDVAALSALGKTSRSFRQVAADEALWQAQIALLARQTLPRGELRVEALVPEHFVSRRALFAFLFRHRHLLGHNQLCGGWYGQLLFGRLEPALGALLVRDVSVVSNEEFPNGEGMRVAFCVPFGSQRVLAVWEPLARYGLPEGVFGILDQARRRGSSCDAVRCEDLSADEARLLGALGAQHFVPVRAEARADGRLFLALASTRAPTHPVRDMMRAVTILQSTVAEDVNAMRLWLYHPRFLCVPKLELAPFRPSQLPSEPLPAACPVAPGLYLAGYSLHGREIVALQGARRPDGTLVLRGTKVTGDCNVFAREVTFEAEVARGREPEDEEERDIAERSGLDNESILWMAPGVGQIANFGFESATFVEATLFAHRLGFSVLFRMLGRPLRFRPYAAFF